MLEPTHIRLAFGQQLFQTLSFFHLQRDPISLTHDWPPCRGKNDIDRKPQNQHRIKTDRLLGINPIIYANSNYAKNYFEKDVAQYDLWLANWTLDADKPPAKLQYGIWDKWHFWQYTSHGAVDGIKGRVDRDVFEGTMLDLAQFVPNFHPGDYDGNGRVDDRDKAVWRKMKGQTVNPGTGADGDLSGTVDDADLAVWKANNGKSYAAGSHRSPAPRDK
jgi:hypothetical protein